MEKEVKFIRKHSLHSPAPAVGHMLEASMKTEGGGLLAIHLSGKQNPEPYLVSLFAPNPR